ncbi:MAG: hypothetical protein AB7I50_09005 [Vicinamibacterales bacterium]
MRLTNSRYGLLVLDVGLPQVNGLEVLEVVRSEVQLASRPVVMTGAEIERGQMHRIMELGEFHRHLGLTIPEVFEILFGCRVRVTSVDHVAGAHCGAMDLYVVAANTRFRCSVHADDETLASLAAWLGVSEAAGAGADQMGE